ncbi:segregation and condensation protein A [Penaeicola halotolerans]|uniref:segregation and condensation protein A n=1 Tax=Penaeicola halotolerans TaxID=2793196 RepID=UPI001CF8121B|nr:segregation/condensation protein A [Penaeicola halotolerans]
MSFEVKIPLFEGPFDLLLFFIERDELDIYDIPISQITNDFLDYLHHLEKLEIEVASEFILVAATLMRIKAKMLLPRPKLNEDGEEIDPRDELIRHLLEYKKYKSVLSELAKLEEERLTKEVRGNISKELKYLAATHDVEDELQDLDLYKLLKVYQKMMQKFAARQDDTTHTVVQYPYTIEQQKTLVMDLLSQKEKIPFTDLISYKTEKIFVIYSFLAILELLQLSLVTLHLGEGFNNFWIEKIAEVPAPAL